MRRLIIPLLLAALAAPLRAAEPPAALPPLPAAVASFGAAVVDGSVYVYGGHSGKTHHYSTETVVGTFRRLRLDGSGKWEDLAGGPGLQGLALVAHGGKLYRIGGMQPRNAPGTEADMVSVADCARFDPAAGKWEALAPLPEPRSSHDAVVVGNTLVVAGGWRQMGRSGESVWYDTALVMDLSQPQPKWETVAQPFRRRALQTAALNGKVYVIGGIDPDSKVHRRVDVFDPAARTWTKGPDLPGGSRNGFSAGAAVAGGRLFASPADGKVYRLSSAGDAWEPVATLQTPRIVHRLVAAPDGRLVALGGAAKQEMLALVEAVRPGEPTSR